MDETCSQASQLWLFEYYGSPEDGTVLFMELTSIETAF